MEFRLGQSAPNPFGKTSTINYSLAREGQVSVRIFNARGQIVRTLVDGLQAPGAHTVSWNGQDDLGRRLPSGTYLYQMRSGEFVETRKMIKLD
jgi:flagellar hook assembly protein FlgD